MKTTRYFGKCKACRVTRVVDAKQGNAYPTPVGGTEIAGVYYMSASFILVPFMLAVQDGYMPCDCGRAMRWERLKATFSAVHECNAKCLSSKGPSCECSCGGKNHGSSHLG